MTRGAGFIDGHLAESFLEDGHEVTVLDNLESLYTEGTRCHTLNVRREVAEERATDHRLVKDNGSPERRNDVRGEWDSGRSPGSGAETNRPCRNGRTRRPTALAELVSRLTPQ